MQNSKSEASSGKRSSSEDEKNLKKNRIEVAKNNHDRGGGYSSGKGAGVTSGRSKIFDNWRDQMEDNPRNEASFCSY